MNRRTFLKFFGLLPALPLAARLPAVSEPVTLAKGTKVVDVTQGLKELEAERRAYPLIRVGPARLWGETPDDVVLVSHPDLDAGFYNEIFKSISEMKPSVLDNIDMDALRREYYKNL